MTTKKPAKRAQTTEEENNDPMRAGPLLGIGGGYALDDFDGIGMATDGSGSINGHVGYHWNPWDIGGWRLGMATDLQVERYFQFGGSAGEVNGWAIGLNERFYPIDGRFQPFAEIGITYLDLETTNTNNANVNKTDDGVATRFGLGLDVYATNKFLITTDVSYLLGHGELDDYAIVAFSWGIAFRP